jgi:hypothetical protein
VIALLLPDLLALVLVAIAAPFELTDRGRRIVALLLERLG